MVERMTANVAEKIACETALLHPFQNIDLMRTEKELTDADSNQIPVLRKHGCRA